MYEKKQRGNGLSMPPVSEGEALKKQQTKRMAGIQKIDTCRETAFHKSRGSHRQND